MSSTAQKPAWHRSIFARLVMIMLIMAASLLLIVSVFYYHVVNPRMNESFALLIKAHARILIERQPDLQQARAYSQHLNLEIRFEGNDSSWTTDEDIPTVAELEHVPDPGRVSFYIGSAYPSGPYFIAEAPEGIYVFGSPINDDFAEIHHQILISLLAVMGIVFLAAYLILKRTLRPLKLLTTGVQQLSEGKLDVEVPKQTHDEFGALTDSFNRMASRVRDMVQAREQLLLDVSHELRSPLTRMKVALALVPDDARKQDMAADINEMEIMVTELLELNRLAAGVDIQTEQLHLVPLIHGVVERFEGRPPGVVVNAATQQVILNAEPERLRTVLRNLIENAIKFSLPDSRAVEVNVTVADDHAVVCVVDDGVGVQSDDTDRLFEPFLRVDPSRSRKTGGFGLGLSICKRIIDAHDGTIAMERNEGRGVTLRLTWPLL